MNPLRLALGICLSTYIFQARADYSAEIFATGSNKQTKLFSLAVKDLAKSGDIEKFHAVYSDPAGAPAYEEVGELQGSKIVKINVTQRQTGESAVVEVKDGKVHFTLTKDGKTSTTNEKLEEPFVMAGNMHRFIKDSWADLMAGKTVKMRYGVWFRQDTVGFSLKKINETGDGAAKIVTLKLDPSSFVIRQLVDPVEFDMAGDGSRFVELRGRVSPKQKKGDAWKDLDAVMVYKY